MNGLPPPVDSPLVLIVDDDQLTRRLLRRFMEHEGYRVAEATNGLEALSQYMRLRPGIILMDGMMPGLDGFEACAQLQTLPGGAQTPVLMITSLDDNASVDHAFTVGASDYVTKPIHWAVLRQRVRRLLQARRTERLKTEFVSLVSHEIRTPLTSIKGFTDLILEGAAGDISGAAREFLQIVQTSADRLVALVNDLLDTERIDSGKIKLEVRPMQVSGIIYETLNAIAPLIANKQQQVRVDMPPSLPLALADHDRLAQILTNLLSNAYKYTPAGGSICVSVEIVANLGPAHPPKVEPDGAWLVISVTDTGIGIAAADQPHLFSRFYRVNHPAAHEAGGTGLGLSIVQSLVTLHGGKVWLSSQPGQGSTFTFSLPTVPISGDTLTGALETPAVVKEEVHGDGAHSTRGR